MLRVIKASETAELNISDYLPFEHRTESNRVTRWLTVIENEAARVARLGAEVFKVEVESLDDASRDKNRRTPCTTRTDSTK